jgi:hypothetical protein
MTATQGLLPVRYNDPASYTNVTSPLRRANESRPSYSVETSGAFYCAYLRPILTKQNISVDMTLMVIDPFEGQGVDTATTGNWDLSTRAKPASGAVIGYQVLQPRRPQPRRISLEEAEHLAVEALLQAEERRQEERRLEAAFWAALEEDEE